MKRTGLKGASWDSMLLAAVKVVTTLATIVQTKMLATGFTLTEYGTYSQALIVLSIVTSIIMLGLGDAVNFFYNRKTDATTAQERISFVNTIYFIEMIVGVVFAGGIVLCRGLISDYFANKALAAVLVVVSIKPLLDNMLALYQVLYVSVGKAKLIAIRNLVIVALKIALLWISVYVLRSIEAIFVSLIILDILQLILFKVLFANDGFAVNPFRVSFEKIKPILCYSLPMCAFSLTSVLTRDIDKLLIGHLADTEMLAIYTNCSKILPFDIISASFSVVLIPYIMRFVSGNERASAGALFRNYIKVGYYSVWILGAAVLITSGQVIPFLYTDEYLTGQAVFCCYVLDSMLRFASMHLILTSSGKTKTLLVYSLFSLVLNTILNVVLYHWIGFLGPAIATLIVAALYTLAILQKSIRLLQLRWTDIIDVKDITAFIAILVVTSVGFYFLNRLVLSLGVQRYASMILCAGGFCAVNLMINLKKIRHTLSVINQLKLS